MTHEHKGQRDLVTSADLEAEAAIEQRLRAAFPSDSLLAEESGLTGTGKGRVWIVDPLDGTTNFRHGHPLYAASIALWIDGVSQVAVVAAPSLERTYWAVRGVGAYESGQPLRVASNELAFALLATGFSYERLELEHGALELFGQLLSEAREVRRGGSAALDLAFTAQGIFDGYWEYYLKPHDVAAGSLLVTEAGGIVTDVAGGTDYLYGQSIVAGSPSVHATLLERVRAGGPEHPG